MTDETTPDAVSLVHELLYAASQQGPEETDQVADRLLSAIHAERARHAEEVAEARRQKELWRQETASLQGAVHKLMDQLEAEEARVTSLRSLIPDVRECAEYCRNILIGPPGMPVQDYPLAPVALAARNILAALDSQGGEGE